ncbi:MAG: caspase family protein, partial [Archangiaceae bacterium]|nr:caspase family protein [Archangiaceae bacterium]
MEVRAGGEHRRRRRDHAHLRRQRPQPRRRSLERSRVAPREPRVHRQGHGARRDSPLGLADHARSTRGATASGLSRRPWRPDEARQSAVARRAVSPHLPQAVTPSLPASLRRFAIVIAGLVACAAQAEGPTRRFALFIGNNEGGEGTRPLLYATDDAKRMHEVMIRLGGTTSNDAMLLLNESSDDVLTALAELERRARDARTHGDRTSLFFYYSGHAKDGALRLGSTKLPMESVKARLAQGPTDMRVAVFDACRSGSITRTKGVRKAPAFEVETDATRAAKGLVILTSSASDEDSQESDAIGASYFSYHLASGLLGSADQSGDGRVSLAEAYAYAYERTVASTADSAAGPQHPTFSFDLAGNGDLMLTDVAQRREGLRIPGEAPAGTYFLIDRRGVV